MIVDRRHRNGLAVVDSVISRIRRSIRAELLESGRESWVDAMVSAVDSLNRRPLDYLLGERPVDTDTNQDLNFHLTRQAGEMALAQTRKFDSVEDRLKAAGKFCVLKRPEKAKSQVPVWSARVYTLD